MNKKLFHFSFLLPFFYFFFQKEKDKKKEISTFKKNQNPHFFLIVKEHCFSCIVFFGLFYAILRFCDFLHFPFLPFFPTLRLFHLKPKTLSFKF